MLEYLVSVLIDRWETCLMVQLVVSIRSSSGGGFGHSYTFHTILCVCCTKQVQVVYVFTNWDVITMATDFLLLLIFGDLDTVPPMLWQLITNSRFISSFDMVQMVGDDVHWFSCSSTSISLSRTFFNSSAAHYIPYSTLLVKINSLSVLTLARFSYLAITTGLLTFGAVILNWICEKITEAGFGKWLSHIILRRNFCKVLLVLRQFWVEFKVVSTLYWKVLGNVVTRHVLLPTFLAYYNNQHILVLVLE